MSLNFELLFMNHVITILPKNIQDSISVVFKWQIIQNWQHHTIWLHINTRTLNTCTSHARMCGAGNENKSFHSTMRTCQTPRFWNAWLSKMKLNLIAFCNTILCVGYQMVCQHFFLWRTEFEVKMREILAKRNSFEICRIRSDTWTIILSKYH